MAPPDVAAGGGGGNKTEAPLATGLGAHEKKYVAATTTAAGVVALVAGAAGAGAIGKLVVLESLGCVLDSSEESISWELHPTRVAIGKGVGSTRMGALVMNQVIIMGFYAAMLLVAAVLKRVMDSSWDRAFGAARVPGMMYVPTLFLLQGSSLLATQIIFRPSVHSSVQLVFATAVLLLCFAFPFWLWRFVLRRAPLKARVVPDPGVCGEDGKGRGKYADSRLYWMVFGHECWVADSYFAEKFGVMFDNLREGCLFQIYAEIASILGLSLLAAWMPTSAAMCDLRNWLVCALLFLYFLLIAVTRPFLAPLENIIVIALTFLVSASALCMTLAVSYDVPKNHGLYAAATGGLISSAVLVCIQGIWAITVYIWDVRNARRSGMRDAARNDALLVEIDPLDTDEDNDGEGSDSGGGGGGGGGDCFESSLKLTPANSKGSLFFRRSSTGNLKDTHPSVGSLRGGGATDILGSSLGGSLLGPLDGGGGGGGPRTPPGSGVLLPPSSPSHPLMPRRATRGSTAYASVLAGLARRGSGRTRAASRPASPESAAPSVTVARLAGSPTSSPPLSPSRRRTSSYTRISSSRGSSLSPSSEPANDRELVIC